MKKYHCYHYLCNDQGCGFTDEMCNYLHHDGTGKLNDAKIKRYEERRSKATAAKSKRGVKSFKRDVPAGTYRVAYTQNGVPKFKLVEEEDEA
jgi:hypothetical protein